MRLTITDYIPHILLGKNNSLIHVASSIYPLICKMYLLRNTHIQRVFVLGRSFVFEFYLLSFCAVIITIVEQYQCQINELGIYDLLSGGSDVSNTLTSCEY